MAGSSDKDKTEEPTQHKLQEARKQGDVATSPEITGAVVALVGLLVVQSQGPHIVQGLEKIITQDLALTAHPQAITGATVGAQMRSDFATGLLLVAPLAAAVFVGVISVGALNTRGLMSLKGIKPSFKKLNPMSNFKHVFGKEALVQLAKVLLKIAVIAAVILPWQSTWTSLIPQLSFIGNVPASSTLWDDTIRLAMQMTGAFVAIGAVDFGYRQWAWRRRQRMSKQEVKEESKRMEGNPQMKARMRQVGRRRLRALLAGPNLRAVPKADVVVTNPTHYAVAIQYTPGKMRAPKVIAKGQRLFALRIKEIARKHNIPMVENRPLAQALFKSVQINQEVPADLYKAVAQVLAFVYRLRATRRGPRRPSASSEARP
jgi:flagellar biosynthetic protein FlhB